MKLKLENRKDEILFLYEKYQNIDKVAKHINEYPQAVKNVLKKYSGIKSFSPNQGNVNYFSNIDTHAKAYILGFIAADGSLVKTKTSHALTITIKNTDVSILEFIKSEIGFEHKIQEIKRKCSFEPYKEIHHNRIVISNKQLSTDLMLLGIYPNKSLILGNIIENIPYIFRSSFIIGYFDGDGSVSKINTIKEKFNKKENVIKQYPCYNLSVSFRGTFSFLEGICNHLDIKKSFIRQYDSIPQLTFANKKDTLKLFNCYKNLDFFLERKHKIFLERINHPSYDKYK